MPSVNDLSKQLAVNPMTVSRAYNLLHDLGVLERQRGIGMRVAGNATLPVEQRVEMLEPAATELLRQADQLGVELPQLHSYLETLKESQS